MEASSGEHTAWREMVPPAATERGPVTWIFFTGWVTSRRYTSCTPGLDLLAATRSHSPRWTPRSVWSLTTRATPMSVVEKETRRLLASSGVQTALSEADAPAASTITRCSVASRSNPAIAGSSGS